jgi:hypothetical protein
MSPNLILKWETCQIKVELPLESHLRYFYVHLRLQTENISCETAESLSDRRNNGTVIGAERPDPEQLYYFLLF